MNPKVLSHLAGAVAAVGVKDENGPNACIASSAALIAGAKPAQAPLISLALDSDSHSCACVERERVFTLSVLSEETPATVIGALGFVSGANTGKLENVRHKVLLEGVPVIKEKTCCWFLCQVLEQVSLRGRTVFLAEITAGSDLSAGVPMSVRYYREMLHGSAPRRSPLYLSPELRRDQLGGESFVCTVCGYVYNDPNFGFEELPEDWFCPICHLPKRAFQRKK